ncbi:Hcp family type VI secretion system effector [Roseateles sp. GG27B]
MPGNTFIQFKAASVVIPGESLQIGHTGDKGWNEISDWSWDIEAETNFLKGTGAAVGKPTSGVLSFTHTYDKSSPVLMQYILKGTHFTTMKIHMLKQTGKSDGLPEIYFQLNAKDVFITKVASKGGEDGSVSQDVELVFKEVTVGYKMQANDGKLGTEKPFNWNVASMNQTTDSLIALDWTNK